MVSQVNGTYYCKSTDTKPVGCVTNGTKLVEMDTGKEYYFDGAGNPAASGSSGFPRPARRRDKRGAAWKDKS